MEIRVQPGETQRVASIIILVDGQPLDTVREPPYRALWPLALGRHTVEAVVVTDDAARFFSPTVPFSVLPQPPPQFIGP